MCATVIWALRAEMLDDAFRAMTLERLGVEPQPTPFTVASKRVGADAETFTLTRRMCDCDGVVGLRGREQVEGETPAAALLDWLHALPGSAAELRRISVLRAWSPSELTVAPRRSRGVQLTDVDERLLRGVEDDMLLTIDLR